MLDKENKRLNFQEKKNKNKIKVYNEKWNTT